MSDPTLAPAAESAPDYSNLDFGAGTVPEPAAPAVPPSPGAAVPAPTVEPAAEAQTVHPSWEKAFDDAGIPEMLRPKLVEKIRADEAAVQRQIEAARGNVPPEWKSLLEDARASNVTPVDLINSYHAVQQLREDPLTFQATLNSEIDALVAAGQLTRAEGVQAKADAQQAVDNAGDDDVASMLTPEAREIAELRRRLDEREQFERVERERMTAEQAAQQEEQALIQQYDQLLNDSGAAVLADPRLAAVVGAANTPAALNAQINVARLADSILQGGSANSPAEAIRQAVEQLASLLPKPTGVASTAPPVQGGSSNMPVPSVQKMTDSEREAAMIAEGMRQLGLS